MSVLPKVVGAAIVGLALVVAGMDGYYAVRNWDRMGPLPPGEQVPQFRVATLEGQTFTGADLRGKVTVMTFWATWCPACRSELSDLDEVDEELGAKGVQFLAVNHEGSSFSPRQAAQLARQYRDAKGLTLPVAVDDGSMARTLRVGPIPHTVLFDKKGTLRHIHQGRVATSTIVGEVEELLSE
jgi:thiol-disulfide isomerase/thioredoxin